MLSGHSSALISDPNESPSKPFTLARLLEYDWLPSRHKEPYRQEAMMLFAREAITFLEQYPHAHGAFPWDNKGIASGFGFLLEYWTLLILQDALQTTHPLPIRILEAPLSYDTPNHTQKQRGVDYFICTTSKTRPSIVCGIDITSSPSTTARGVSLFDPGIAKVGHNGFKKHGELSITGGEIIPVCIVSLHDLSFEMWQNGPMQYWGLYAYFLRAVAPIVIEQGLEGDFPYCHLSMDHQRKMAKEGIVRLFKHYINEALAILERDKHKGNGQQVVKKIRETARLFNKGPSNA